MASIAVFYLSRWGNPPLWSEAFFASLHTHRAGRDFELVVMLKGYPDGTSDPALERYRARDPRPTGVLRMKDEGWGFNAFTRGAAALDCERVVFFTSQSRIVAHDWLRAYDEAFAHAPRCGVVGATASYEAIPGASFPNPNVRPNAFAMDRRLWLSLDHGALATRADSLNLEAGPNSLTRQIERMGLEALVVDKTGALWRAPTWPSCRTFRSGRQQNLLVADNRTHHYDVASNARRRRLAALAFAGEAVVDPVSPLARWRAARAWRARPATPA